MFGVFFVVFFWEREGVLRIKNEDKLLAVKKTINYFLVQYL